MAQRRNANPAEAFNRTLKITLDHFNEPLWLGENSVLATPYFLGQYLPDNPDALARGQALQQVIQQAMATLWPGDLPQTQADLNHRIAEERQIHGNKGGSYYFYLLELRYIRQYFSLRTEPTRVVDMYGFLNVSETRFHAHLQQAITALGKCLLQLLRPTLRLEQPYPPTHLVGRTEVVANILTNLTNNNAVAISGTGGVGKTAIGTTIYNQWANSPAFWYTFRPELNDNLNNVLFSLGHFLHQAGASRLWLQLLADEGNITNVNQALGFLRHDLLALNGLPLLCFDEVDLLNEDSQQAFVQTHKPVLEFLESLRGLSPLLLIGQRSLLDTDTHYVLYPLSQADTQSYLGTINVQLDETDLTQVYRYTEGNPRLLALYANLVNTGDDMADLRQMHTSPSAQPLFYRLWKRLDLQERDLLTFLALFRTSAPLDILQAQADVLDRLKQRNLVSVDQTGGATVLTFFRQLIYHELPLDQRQQLHTQVGSIRAERGDYTAAAYHYWQAENFTAAVQVWHPHQDQEILRGQAQAARDIFQRNITQNQLSDKAFKQLKTIRNRLHLLVGKAVQVLTEIRNVDWNPDEAISAEALYQAGQAQAILGQNEHALESYDEAIATLTNLTNKIAEIRFQRGLMFLRETNMQAARDEVQLGHYHLHWLQGIIERHAGNMDGAKTHYQTALALAQSANDVAKIAKIQQDLALVAGMQGNFDLAAQHAQQAMDHFQKIGNRVQLEGMRADLAGFYLGARQFTKVIQPAETALRFFEQIKHEPWVAPICNNLAEAYLELGQLEKAKDYAFRVLDLENPGMRPHALYTLGLVQQRNENMADAEAIFLEGIQVAQQNEDPYIEAYLHKVLGQLYVAMERSLDSITSLETALTLFQKMGLRHESAETEKLLRQ